MALTRSALAAFLLVVLPPVSSLASERPDGQFRPCKQLNYDQSLALHPDKFGAVSLELTIDDFRGWIKKKIRAYVSLAKRGHAQKAKRISGTMTVHTASGVSCTLRVKFRAHGDLDDHYPGNMQLEPSLNVHITDGHLFGITKFILFRPETRKGDNEVFAATVLSAAGFLSPRTSMSSLKIDGSKQPAARVIFQEKIVKEFLEANDVKEGPIIEGDERFAFGTNYRHLRQRAALARLSNYKWALKGPTSRQISHMALEQMNRLLIRYDKGYQTNYNGNLYDMVEIARRLEKGAENIGFPNVPAFEAMVYALGAAHGLSQDDRRLIFDPYTNSFLPIYYDGGASILTGVEDRANHVTITAQNGVPAARERLAQVELDALRSVLISRGLHLKRGDLAKVLSKIRLRLDMIETTERLRKVKVKTRTIYSRKNNRLSYVFRKEDGFEICRDSLTECRPLRLTPKKIVTKLMSQAHLDKGGFPAIYFAFPREELEQEFPGFNRPEASGLKRRSVTIDATRLEYIGDITGRIDHAAKRVDLVRHGATGRAVLSGGRMDGWTVSLDDRSGHKKDVAGGEQNFDALGLTGCLNFYDLEIRDLKVQVSNATCEDGVNFVRVLGTVAAAEISNTDFDALDADFSKITFKNLAIDNARNDCLDLSYGSYKADRLTLTRCGDKAVSIGETTRSEIGYLTVDGAEIGLAAKDYGTIRLKQGVVKNAKTCFALYNKKPEFSGGYLDLTGGQLDCGLAQVSVGPSSKVSGMLH